VSGVVVGQLVSKKTKMSVNQEMIATGNAEEAEEPKSSQVINVFYNHVKFLKLLYMWIPSL